MKRLVALMRMVPSSAGTIADIGYDHGWVLAELARRRPDRRYIGVELQEDAADRFRGQHGPRLAAAATWPDLRVGDGLAALAPGEAQVAILAGLGQGTMLRILREGLTVGGADRLGAPGRLVLCPNGIESELRPALRDLSWQVVDECLVREATRFYEVIAAEPERAGGVSAGPRDELDLRYGRALFERPDPLLVPYLEDLGRRHANALGAGLRSYQPGSSRAALGAKLSLLDEALARARASS